MKIGRVLLAVIVTICIVAAVLAGREALLRPSPVDVGTGQGGGAPTDQEPGDPAPGDPVVLTVPSDAGEARVRYVHDGDTLFLEDGRKVRLLGIDTPEVGENLECFGDEATAALRAALQVGTRVRTVEDVQPLDGYGRSLLFLFTDDGALVNLDLIRAGYAEAVVLEPNVLWAAELEAAEDEAQAASRGIWGTC